MRQLISLHVSFLLLMKLSNSLSDVIVPPGSPLTLPCKSHDVPELDDAEHSWSFQSSSSPNATRKLGTSPKLSLKWAGKDDEGEYTCVTKGLRGEDRMKYSLKHNVKIATIDDFKEWQVFTITERDTFTLPCKPITPKAASPPTSGAKRAKWFKEVEGMPEPMRVRDKDELDVQREGLYWTNGNDTEGDWSVDVWNASIGDSGLYHCHFQEGMQNKSVTLELIVEGLPPPRCHGFMSPWERCEDQEGRGTRGILSESITEFSAKLHARLRESKSAENLLYSPLSIAAVLTHLLLGARGETRRRLEDALCFPPMYACSQKGMQLLKSDVKDSVDIASQLFYNPERILSQSFINQSQEFYGSAPDQLPADAEHSLEMINNWVARSTRNKIPKLLDSVNAQDQLILLNAVYFNGKWKVKFDKKSQTAAFTTLSGDVVPVPALYSSKYKLAAEYNKDLKAQVAVFPLTGKNRLFILLPSTTLSRDLRELEERLTYGNLRAMAMNMVKVAAQYMEVTLPKLKLDVTTDLADLLENIGLGQLFSDPNLCGLFSAESDDTQPSLSDARHRASLTLSETGVEAAAATSMSFSRSFSTFSAMQPFVLLLWSDEANCPLFVGRVTRP
ncbi:plasma protease C1 inhibitor [Denticeps clupeoides]|uniref:Ig-like domain-containing protein n=1 Tax=Denticeps clupeoides TaxID=299321 RepID=A0AAY3ZWY7_9TELE|nr:factor XIIa inhibitor-like [Denticeps clupeoides]